MGIRNAIQDKPWAGITLVVALLAVAIVIRARSSAPKPGSRYYYDLTERRLVTHQPGEELPPVTLPSGNQAVMAHVFACGGCDSDGRFIGYLARYSDAFKQAMTQPQEASNQNPQAIVVDQMIALEPQDGWEPQWVSMSSDAGHKIIDAPRQRCDARPTECMPQ
jgi:hypothetical protein